MGALVAAGDAELGGDAKWLDPRAVPGLTGRSLPLPLSEIDCCCDDNSGRDSGEGGDGDPPTPPPPPGPRPATAGVAKLAMLQPALVPVPAGSLYAKRWANETRASERTAPRRGVTLSSGVRPKSERYYMKSLYLHSLRLQIHQSSNNHQPRLEPSQCPRWRVTTRPCPFYWRSSLLRRFKDLVHHRLGLAWVQEPTELSGRRMVGAREQHGVGCCRRLVVPSGNGDLLLRSKPIISQSVIDKDAGPHDFGQTERSAICKRIVHSDVSRERPDLRNAERGEGERGGPRLWASSQRTGTP